MRTVVWTDDSGYKHRSLVRDIDPNSAAEMGIPLDPPDLSQLDWEEIQREIHNRLVDSELSNYRAVLLAQNSIGNAVRRVLTRKILELYRQSEAK